MSITIENLKAIATQQRKLSSQLPNEFIAFITDYQLKDDKRGKESLFLNLKLNDGEAIVKYTSYHILDLANALEKLGFTSLEGAKGKPLKWKHKSYLMGYPRPLPIEKV